VNVARKNNGRRPTLATMPTPMKRLYFRWSAMIQRCHTPANKSFPRYGGKGVSVCARWRESFDDFMADMGFPSAGQSLDRIDSKGNYEPANCRWADIVTQNNNRAGSIRHVEIDGERLSMRQAWRKYAPEGVTYGMFRWRIVDQSWPVQETISTGRYTRYHREDSTCTT
jgi:hypothetical protein